MYQTLPHVPEKDDVILQLMMNQWLISFVFGCDVTMKNKLGHMVCLINK